MAIKHKKLKEWVAAGLMTDGQADAIHAYEEDKKGGRFGRGLVGLSLFAILVGVLSIIAANWAEISGGVKIAVHLALNAGIGLLALYSDKKGRDLWREGAALVFLGLTFTLIILIGQVFQLTGTIADAMLFWFVITLPFFLLMGRSHMTAVPWMLAFLGTICVVLGEKLVTLPSHQQTLIVSGIAALLPLALMADGTISVFRKIRPALSDVALRTGLALSVLLASISLAIWPANDMLYARDIMLSTPHGLIILAAGFTGLVVHAGLHGFYRHDPLMRHGSRFAALGLIGFIAPLIVPVGHDAIVPALVFIIYWVTVGWLAQGAQQMRVVSLAITIIAIRIFMIYVQVFGSLMDTGFGLISGGVVMLALIYGARRLNKRIAHKVAV